jgi:hypothetical protein
MDKKKGKIPFVDVWMNSPPEETVQRIIEGLNALKIKK